MAIRPVSLLVCAALFVLATKAVPAALDYYRTQTAEREEIALDQKDAAAAAALLTSEARAELDRIVHVVPWKEVTVGGLRVSTSYDRLRTSGKSLDFSSMQFLFAPEVAGQFIRRQRSNIELVKVEGGASIVHHMSALALEEYLRERGFERVPVDAIFDAVPNLSERDVGTVFLAEVLPYDRDHDWYALINDFRVVDNDGIELTAGGACMSSRKYTQPKPCFLANYVVTTLPTLVLSKRK